MSGSSCYCQSGLNNRILIRRQKSKQHEEIPKVEQSPLSHACTTTVQKMSDGSPFVQAEQRSKALTESLIAHLLVYTAQRWGLDKQLISLEIGPNWGKTEICDKGGIGRTLMGKWLQIKAKAQWAEWTGSTHMLSKGALGTLLCVPPSHPLLTQRWSPTPPSQDILKYLDTSFNQSVNTNLTSGLW